MCRHGGVILRSDPEGPDCLLAGWARRRGIALATVAVGDAPFPALDGGHDFAVVFATPTPALVAWLRDADSAGTPLLGFAAGAHAVSTALGGATHRLDRPAIGWREVESADHARVPQGPWLTWQEQAMTPPPLSYELAWNRDGTQAFCLRRHLAVQFHPEATAQLLVAWVAELEGAGLDAGALSGRAPSVPAAERLFDGFAARAGLALV